MSVAKKLIKQKDIPRSLISSEDEIRSQIHVRKKECYHSISFGSGNLPTSQTWASQVRVGTGRIFCIRSGPASFKICPVRSGRNPAGSFLMSIRQKSDRNPAKKSKKIRQKSGFVRPDELFVRSCPVRPDRSRTAGPVPTLSQVKSKKVSRKNLFCISIRK